MSTMTIHEVRFAPRRVTVQRSRDRAADPPRPRRRAPARPRAGLAAGIFLGAGSVATERPGTPEPTRVVQVGTGDTLWAIAADAAAATGEDDVRAMVDRIERLNALESGMVLAGQRLRVPTD